MEVGRIRLEMENQHVFVEGTQPTITLRAIEDDSDRPVVGVPVTIKLISTHDKPRELFKGAGIPVWDDVSVLESFEDSDTGDIEIPEDGVAH